MSSTSSQVRLSADAFVGRERELAAQLSLRVTRAVMPDFFFHERGEH